MTSKKDLILALHAQGKTTREIAKAVYGVPDSAPQKVADRKMAYIRVVLRQRKGGGASDIDRRSLMRRFGAKTYQEAIRIRNAGNRDYRAAWQKRKYHSNPAYRAAKLAYHRRWRMALARESARV